MTGSLQPYRGGAQLRQCKAPHTALPRGLHSYPEWPSLKVKHQSQLLTSLAPNTQETITSKSPDFRNPTLHHNSIVKMLQLPSNRVRTTNLKGFFMTMENHLFLQFLVLGSERVVQIHDLTAPADYSKEAVPDNWQIPSNTGKLTTRTKSLAHSYFKMLDKSWWEEIKTVKHHKFLVKGKLFF